MTERPHIKPPLHGTRLRRYRIRQVNRAYRHIGRAAENAGIRFNDAAAALRQVIERTYIETGELPQEDA